MKKKLLSLALAAVMVMSLSVTALAGAITDESTGVTTYSDDETITISKTYNATNSNTTSPEETFYLVQRNTEVVDGEASSAPDLVALTGENLPTITTGKLVGSVKFEKGEATSEKDIEITLPSYDNVGIYKYTLEEVAGTTAGVEYFEGEIYLVVTVINDEEGKMRIAAVHTETTYGEEGWTSNNKSDEIKNTYSAGTLEVTKNVTGNLGDKSKYFKVTVTLTGESGKTYEDSYEVTGGAVLPEELNYTNPTSIKINESTVFYLKNGDTLSIANLPYGVTYSVVEDDYTAAENGGYDNPSYSYEDINKSEGEEKKIDSEKETAAITNNKDGEVDTGINLDTLPYIMILAIVFAGIAHMVFRKRMSERY